LASRPVQGAQHFETGLATLFFLDGLAHLLLPSLAIDAILFSTPLRFTQNLFSLLGFTLHAGSLPLLFASLTLLFFYSIFLHERRRSPL